MKTNYTDTYTTRNKNEKKENGEQRGEENEEMLGQG